MSDRSRSTGSRGRSRSQGSAAAASVSAARLVAYDVLRDVDDREAYANLALASRIREARLQPRDAALATELAAGTLRGMGRYDRIIELASGRELAQVDPRTRRVLRLGVHQLLAMRTAAHAAVNESVELQRRVGEPRAAGFVNGVLRAVSRESAEAWDARISASAPSEDVARAQQSSHPVWVLRALRNALRAEGREGELEALLLADNLAPRVNLCALPGVANATEPLTSVPDTEVSATGPSPLGLELRRGEPARVIAALSSTPGAVRVQDQGSQLAALALTRVRPAAGGERWLDLCAGPGGKTAILGAEARGVGASVRANEMSEHRAELVRAGTVAVRDAVTVVCHDGRSEAAFSDTKDASDGMFDRILVDAPCSGLGALRRRPEARWRKVPEDLPELTALQGELLDAAAAHLMPGGVIAYVTCSPHLAETRMVVNAALRRHPELRELDARSTLQSISRVPLDLAGNELSAQLWPHRHGTDAMFIALLDRDPGSAHV